MMCAVGSAMGLEFDGENPRCPFAVGPASEPASVVRGRSPTDHEHVVSTHGYQTDTVDASGPIADPNAQERTQRKL